MPEPLQVLRADKLTVARGGRAVLSELDLEVLRGPPIAIVGPSGCGKTTLLMALAGLGPITSGTATVLGVAIADLPPRERARRVGVVFQDYQLFPHLDVMENICLGPRLHGVEGHRERARELLELLEIWTLAERGCHELSGGQRQRVAIARCLVLEPGVVLFDEPSAALDPRTTRDLAAVLTKLSTSTQIVVVSHDKPFVEACCPRAVRLDHGHIAATGAPDEVFD